MATSDPDDVGTIDKLRQDHELLTATVIYVAISVVAYIWLAGPVGGAGSGYVVHPQVAIGGLLSGALLFIPLLMSVISESEYQVVVDEASIGEE